MSFKLKPTRNNPYPIEIKKEIEILEETTIGQYNNYQIPFKREPSDNNAFDFLNNNQKIIQLEQENLSLKLKIQEQSNEINELKLRLNKYEPSSNHQMLTHELAIGYVQSENEISVNSQSEEKTLPEPDEKSSCELDPDSDQMYDETNKRVINKIFIF
jgi:hypothetical protein